MTYPKVFNLGHRYLKELFDGEVVVQEKVDGSQFNFGLKDGKLWCRSKGAEIDTDNPVKLFAPAVYHIKSVQSLLTDGWNYRGEVLISPKHNTLTYGRIPRGSIVLFDIDDGNENYTTPDRLLSIATILSIDCAPLLFQGVINKQEELGGLLEKESFLGGVKVEGIVIKNYNRFGIDKKALMGKWVREEFKEKNKKEWRKVGESPIEVIIKTLRTEARWQKAVQHLKEAGELKFIPQDIPLLIKEVDRDIREEEEDWLKTKLLAAYWKEITRGVTKGLPEWYKEQLGG